MELTRPFTSLNKQNADIAGGKGASLGEMTQAGIPVPPGFVVLSDSFEQFIRETDLVQEIDAILHKVDHKEIHTVEKASEDIKGLILSREMPKDIADDIEKNFKILNSKFVAVRSSATAEDGAEHAWAGQLDSFLNTTEADLLDKVKRCWASLFTPRAIFYRFEKGLHTTKISVAVVVQKMVESEVSGIAFSVHPVTEDRNQLIIEAGFGLGEAIVSGSVTPDSYVVEKSPRKIIDINVSTQTRGLYRSENRSADHGNNEWKEIPEPRASSQVLDEAQISNLSDIIVRIEEHYGFPCDIEWAYETGNFYVVQSRPITTLSPALPSTLKEHSFNTPELKGFNPEEYHYLGLWKQDLFSACFWHDCWVPELVDQFRMTANGVGSFGFLGGHYLVKKSMMASFHDQISEKILSKDEEFFKNLLRVADSVYLKAGEVGEALRSAKPNIENFKTFVEEGRKINFLWALGACHFIEPAEALLQDIVVKEKFPADKVLDIIPELITPHYLRHKDLVELKRDVGSKTFEEIKEDSVLLSKLQKQVDAYPWIEVFNFIGEPMTVERLYEEISHMKDTEEDKSIIRDLSTELEWRAKCMSCCGYIKQAGAEYFSIYSEKVLPFLKNVANEIGVSYSELLSLTTTEIEKALIYGIKSDELNKLAKNRKENGNEWCFVAKDNGGVIFTENHDDIRTMEDLCVPKGDMNANEIRGTVGNPGKYTGPARIIMNTPDFNKMQAGDVLVSTMTTPDFIVLMKKSGAIVTDIGGLLCHAAIVSREMNKPCVIGTKFATQLLKDGDEVEVDANNGVVRILKKNSLESGLSNIFKDKSEYIGLGQWVSPVIEYEAWMDWSNTVEAKEFDLGSDNPASIAVNGHYFVPKGGSYSKLRETIGDEFKTGKFKTTKKLLDLAEDISNECLKRAEKLGSHITFEEFLRAFDLMSRLRFPWMACFPIGDAGEEYVRGYAKENNLSVDEVVEMIPQLSNSVNDDQKELSLFKEQIENEGLSFDISSIEKKNKKLADKIKKYQQETEYIGTHHFWGDERTLDRLMDAIKNASQISKEEKNEKANSEAFEIIARATKWRLECAQSSAFLAYRFRKFMAKLAAEHGLTYGELIFLSTREIEGLIGGQTDVLSTIAQRQQGVGILKLGGQVNVVVGQELDSWEKHFGLQEKIEGLDEFRGAIGNKGIVRGPVVIVLKPDDQSKVHPGVVLVAPETTPDFIPAMGKAAAFVTDQGGITSHAAIVAREMGKPCITGTKVATKVLKDGDEVEVDANNGIVRILKKND